MPGEAPETLRDALRCSGQQRLDARRDGPTGGAARGHADQRRMPRSADVSASENAGRANRRSAYFISGAAVFGICTP